MHLHHTFRLQMVLYLMVLTAERQENADNCFIIVLHVLKNGFQLKARVAIAQHVDNKTESQ